MGNRAPASILNSAKSRNTHGRDHGPAASNLGGTGEGLPSALRRGILCCVPWMHGNDSGADPSTLMVLVIALCPALRIGGRRRVSPGATGSSCLR